MKFSLFYIPCSSKQEAKYIACSLLESQFIACANIIDRVGSLYIWEGEIQEDNEVLLLVKSKTDNFSRIEKEVKKLHSYDYPCVIQLDIAEGNAEYLDWIDKNTL